MPLRRVTDERCRFSVARAAVAEALERGIHPIVLSGVHTFDLPIEGRKDRLEMRHREHHPVRQVELALIVVDHHAQVVEVFLAGVHDRFPNRPFLQLAIATQAITIEPR